MGRLARRWVGPAALLFAGACNAADRPPAPAAAPVVGEVREGGAGPVAGAELRLLRADSATLVAAGATGADGRLWFGDAAYLVGEYVVSLTVPGGYRMAGGGPSVLRLTVTAAAVNRALFAVERAP